jgi:predicted aldo/keto reductase-like oxidoreductase
VGGGRFGEDSPVFRDIIREVGAESVSELAVRYVASHPHIDTMLNGIESPADVDRTLAAVSKPRFTAAQMTRIEAFARGLFRESVGFCTACLYCLPCPQGINIPRVMTAIYEHRFLKLEAAARRTYASLNPKPGVCTSCGQCVPKCTQKLNIPEQMAYAARTFEPQEPCSPRSTR